MKNLFLFGTLLLVSLNIFAQQKPQDSINVRKLDEVLITAIRVNADSPITHSNIDKEELKERNLGQDIPTMVNFLPSVVTTSDAGSGIGYSGIRVRGSDATRVNVTINGIPYNDPESQGTFWVNLGDFTSSVESLQLQRGVGTSTNGSGAFGASLNILTDAYSNDAYGEISSSLGSFNTQKHTIKLSTGLLNNHIEISGRFSKIDSDGYVDRAFTDLKAYFLQGLYKDDNTLIKVLTFGNKEKTYQSWYGVSAEDLETDRTKNYYTYDNETDNYWQDHYQLHWNEKLNNNWTTNLGLNYTKGEGYFEQYKDNTDDIALYNGIVEASAIDDEGTPITDVIRRRWLDNDSYVINANATFKTDKLQVISGLSYNNYAGDHFGEVIWAQQFSDTGNIRDRYYFGDATKIDFSVFSKATYKVNGKWTAFLDLQGRFVDYKTNGLNSGGEEFKVDANFDFFNPKLGATYKMSDTNSLYASYARANREPNRDDFKSGVSKHETLNDFELGWRYNTNQVKVNTNIYYMLYDNQLVLTGAFDDVGSPIKASSGKSYRLGLEADANIKLSKSFNLQPNFAVSDNKNVDFVKETDGTSSVTDNTTISFSPGLVAGNIITYSPNNKLQLSLLSKYVGEQYLNNIDDDNSKLDSYFVNDLNVIYTIKPNKIVKEIIFTGLVNNLFSEEYESNGADYGWGYIYYYPQATIKFLDEVTLQF